MKMGIQRFNQPGKLIPDEKTLLALLGPLFHLFDIFNQDGIFAGTLLGTEIFRHVAIILGFSFRNPTHVICCDFPICKRLAMPFQFGGIFLVRCKVFDFPRVVTKIVKFLFGSFGCINLALDGIEFSLFEKLFHADEDLLAILVAIGLKMRPFVEEVTDVFEIFRTDGTDMLHGFIGSVPGAECEFTGFIIHRENIPTLHILGDRDACKSQ